MTLLLHPFRSSSGFDPDQDTASLIWEPNDTPVVSLTPSSSGDRRTFTIHLDVQINKLDTYQSLLMVFGAANDSGVFNISLDSSNRLGVAGNATNWRITTEYFVDTIGRYQITIAVDSTNGTASNRMRIYNGRREVTSFDANNTIALNHDFAVNHTYEHRVGNGFGLGPAIMSGTYGSVTVVDGTQLTGSDFVDVDSRGEEVFVKYSGSYGTNGTFLSFNDASTQATLGTNDEGADWSVSGVTTTESVDSSWSKNFPTLNILNPLGGTPTVSSGALRITASDQYKLGSFAFPSTGKWWFEGYVVSDSSGQLVIGVQDIEGTVGGGVFTSGDHRIYASNQFKYDGGGAVSYGNGFTTGDTVLCLVNMDDGELSFVVDDVSDGVAFTDLVSSGKTWTLKLGEANASGTWELNCGQRTPANTIPTGYKALNTANLPVPTITDGSEHVNLVTVSHGGTSTDFDISFDTDVYDGMFWIKRTDSTGGNYIIDGLRGYNKYGLTNSTAVDQTDANVLSVSGTVGTLGSSLAAGTYSVYQLKLGLSGGVANTDGSISSTVCVNDTAGISVLTSGAISGGGTIGHGLSQAPELVVARTPSVTSSWFFGSNSLSSWTNYMSLDSGTGETSGSTIWGSTAPSSSVITLGSSFNDPVWIFAAHSVPGFSLMGTTYLGNGSADGPFIYCGFTPSIILIKKVNATGDWAVHDKLRPGHNSVYTFLTNTDAGQTANLVVDITAAGFKISTSSSSWNTSAGTYAYAVFAQWPLGADGFAPASAF